MNKTIESPTLVNTYWKLTKLDGREVITPPREKEAHFILDFQHCIKGFSGCNKIDGSFHADHRAISIQLEKPNRLCPDMKTDEAFRKVLQNANVFKMEGKRLILFQDNIYLAEFEAVYLR
ncbi:MAG: META domain-containing protein [Flavobacteriales bacterium]